MKTRLFDRLRLALGTALLLALLTSCDPVAVIRWALDGRAGLLQTAEGSKIVDGTGKIIGDGQGLSVWTSDSKHAVGVHKVEARDWAEYQEVLGPERAAEVVRAAEELLPVLTGFKGEWNEFADDPAIKRWTAAHPSASTEMAVYYFSQRRAAELTKFLAWWTGPKGNGPVTAPIYELRFGDVSQLERPRVRTILRSADEIPFLLPSPTASVIAFARKRPEGSALEVIASEGGAPLIVAEGAEQADWTPDGLQLVFIRPDAPIAQQTGTSLATLMRQTMCDAAGHLLDKSGDAEELANTVMISGRSRVACLPDGRILFAAPLLKLPVLHTGLPQEVTLFALRPGETPTLERALSAEAQKKLPERIDQFVVSPDGRRLAIPGENGTVAVVSLEKGEVTTLQDKGWEFNKSERFFNTAQLLPVTPGWRGPDELCYVAPMPPRDGHPQRAEMVLHKLGAERRTISQSWTDAATDAFLPREKPPEAVEPAADGQK